MTQSAPFTGIHVAVIMDGNGRWAQARGRPREWGHRRGARAVRSIVEAAPAHGIGILTLYAFSSDNWRRPEREVSALMSLFRRYLRTEVERLERNSVRLSVIGRRDRLPPEVLAEVERADAATRRGSRLLLRLAVDYSSRHALLEASRGLAGDAPGLAAGLRDVPFNDRLGEAIHCCAGAPDVDLLIRTGGEQRLSDFLLWECAYAELVFSPRMWPEFGPEDLADSIRTFRSRERRFGGLTTGAEDVA